MPSVRLNRRCLHILIFAMTLTLVACRDEKDEVEFPISSEDEATIHKIADLGSKAHQLWNGFDYIETEQAYFILTDDDGSNSRGYLLNPSLPLPLGSIKLSSKQSGGMNLYRNDSLITNAYKTLNGTLWRFNNFSVNEVPCFLIRQRPKPTYSFYDYFKDGPDQNNWLPTVMIHEMFHLFQINEWTIDFPPYDWPDFPITTEILTHQLALFELMEQAHKITDPHAAREALVEYVVLMRAMDALDPTFEKIALSVSSTKSLSEGTARYIEHFSAFETIYPTINDDPSHGWHQYINTATTALQVKTAFGLRTWYHVGSASTHLLTLTEENVFEQMQAGKTQYEIAENFLNLTEQQYENALIEIMSRPSWAEYQQHAEYLASLE